MTITDQKNPHINNYFTFTIASQKSFINNIHLYHHIGNHTLILYFDYHNSVKVSFFIITLYLLLYLLKTQLRLNHLTLRWHSSVIYPFPLLPFSAGHTEGPRARTWHPATCPTLPSLLPHWKTRTQLLSWAMSSFSIEQSVCNDLKQIKKEESMCNTLK